MYFFSSFFTRAFTQSPWHNEERTESLHVFDGNGGITNVLSHVVKSLSPRKFFVQYIRTTSYTHVRNDTRPIYTQKDLRPLADETVSIVEMTLYEFFPFSFSYIGIFIVLLHFGDVVVLLYTFVWYSLRFLILLRY